MKFSTVFIIFLGLTLGNFAYGSYANDMPRAIDRTFMQFVFLVSIFIAWKTEGGRMT